MSQSLHESFGGLHLPVQATDVTTTLAPLDPGRDMLLELFSTAVNAELTAAWQKIMLLLPSSQKLDRERPVADTFPGTPTPQVMQERKPVFPMLALHRSGTGTYEPHTLDADKLTQPWELHYILGPLDVSDNRKLQDACVAVSKIVRRVINRGGHPAYQNGALQFFGDDDVVPLFGGIELKSHEGPGPAIFANDEKGTPYYAITMNLETIEFVDSDTTETVGPFEGADYDMGIGGEPAGIIHGLLYANTDHPGT